VWTGVSTWSAQQSTPPCSSTAAPDSRSPFACLLIGQPTLRRLIKLGMFAAFDQRIALRYSMAGMTPNETSPVTESRGAVGFEVVILGVVRRMDAGWRRTEVRTRRRLRLRKHSADLGLRTGAGDENRTRVLSLGIRYDAIADQRERGTGRSGGVLVVPPCPRGTARSRPVVARQRPQLPAEFAALAVWPCHTRRTSPSRGVHWPAGANTSTQPVT